MEGKKQFCLLAPTPLFALAPTFTYLSLNKTCARVIYSWNKSSNIFFSQYFAQIKLFYFFWWSKYSFHYIILYLGLIGLPSASVTISWTWDKLTSFERKFREPMGFWLILVSIEMFIIKWIDLFDVVQIYFSGSGSRMGIWTNAYQIIMALKSLLT